MTPRARRGWFLLGLSCVSWGIGGGIWSYLELVRGEFPFPSAADVGYLAAYPLSILAMLAFPAAPARTVSRLRVLLDATVIVAAMLFVSWAVVLSPVYEASTGSLLADAITLAYPTGDLLLGAIVFLVLARAAPAQRLPLALIAAGLLANSMADSAFLALVTAGSYGAGALVDVGWYVGYLLIGLAALQPERDLAGGETDRPAALWHLLVPYVPFAGTVVVAVGRRLAGYELGLFLFWDAVVLFTALAARQLLALRENHVLVADLHEREAELVYQAFHDPLTGLANRALFRDRVGHALTRQRRSRSTMAVLFCDLDDFKTINDSLATTPATSCSPTWGSGSPPARVSATPPRGWAATSSPCCSRTSTMSPRPARARVASSTPSPHPSCSTATRSPCAAASASRSVRPASSPRMTCCATPMSRCTWPRPGTPAGTSCSTRACARSWWSG